MEETRLFAQDRIQYFRSTRLKPSVSDVIDHMVWRLALLKAEMDDPRDPQWYKVGCENWTWDVTEVLYETYQSVGPAQRGLDALLWSLFDLDRPLRGVVLEFESVMGPLPVALPGIDLGSEATRDHLARGK